MRRSSLITVGAVLVLAAIPTRAHTSVSFLEDLCARRLGSIAVRLATVRTRATTECRIAVAAGEASGPCPGTAGEAEIAPIVARLLSRAELFCESTCSISNDIRCVADKLCPPLPSSGSAESCTAGIANRPFDMGRIGFPGPFCETVLGHPIQASEDLAECTRSLTISASDALVDALFGTSGPALLSPKALDCQRVIARRTRRLAAKIHATLTGCRNAILRGSLVANPADCPVVDPLYAARSAVCEAKLASSVTTACSDTEILELDICRSGPGGITSTADAIECLTAAAYEVAGSPVVPLRRKFTRTSFIDAAYPPAPVCGDADVNQIPSAFLPLGEECDGEDDDACPGQCIPPGDLFECSCADRPRMRLLTDSEKTDLDHGWTGIALDATLPDGAGFVVDLSECDCTEMDGATCSGAAADPVCTTSGVQRPRCSWDPVGGPPCDARGNGNAVDEDRDCWICDAYSANARDACTDERDCAAQCYDANGTATGSCTNGQADCAPGELCRGRCDRGETCVTLTAAPPSPVSRGNSAICIVQTFRNDLSGTTNVMTGEHALFQRTRVSVHLGIAPSVPCPTCGGFCDGGPFVGDPCRGTCSATPTPCRFNTDCPDGETCTSLSSDCPEATCNLSLVCNGGANDRLPCRIESETPMFGAVSSDCPPSLGTNVSGNGLVVDYSPATSEMRTVPSTVPCTAPGYELFDCPCPDDGGRKTQPNPCKPACDSGAEIGLGCADGDNNTGRFTTCSAGIHEGRACDEDSDCPGGACADNPLHCVGDPTFDHVECATNADCGVGDCVDACPDGRCVPLCLPTVDDPENGICASGPSTYHCSGELDRFRGCGNVQAAGSCTATCDVSATPCASLDDCSPGETCAGACERARFCEAGTDGVLGTVDDILGAGVCVEDGSACPLDPIAAEGGDVFNSKGGPERPLSVATFCIGRTSSTAVNTVIGVGGPGRVRRAGTYVTNGFTSLP